eukprot:jgi/Ulvmu1/5307/UM022_0101.1
MSPQPSYYDTLNLERTASSEDVETSYSAFNDAVGAGCADGDAPGLEHMAEAYRVLRDPLRRSTYDLYGKSGLQAGSSLVPVKPLREQWLLYQQNRWDEDKYDMLVQPADVILEWDASGPAADVLKGHMPEVWPVIAGVSVNSALKMERSENSRFMVGYNLRLRNLFSANGNMTGWLQVPLWAQFRTGLRNVLSVGAILGQDAAACVSWMRVCSPNTRAELSARAAPRNVSLQTRVVHKIADHTLDVRARVGHVVSASATATVQLRPAVQLRGSCFCGAVATRAELGVSVARRLTRGYVGVGYGTAGTSLNVRLTRAGHTMHIPILLSSRFDDWRALLLAAAVPTLLNVVVTQVVIKPVLWAVSARSAQTARAERRAEIAQERERALRQQAVMGATVARMAAKEEHRSGFVIVLAAYGRLALFKAELAAAVRHCSKLADSREENGDGDPEPLEREALEGGPEDSWLVVTRPTQLAAVEGHLHLRQGLDKSRLPGFAELNPGGRNEFYVLYKYKGKMYEIEVNGSEEIRVPTAKAAEVSEEKAAFAQRWHDEEPAIPRLGPARKQDSVSSRMNGHTASHELCSRK